MIIMLSVCLQLEDEIQRLVAEACQKVVEEQAQGLGVFQSAVTKNSMLRAMSHFQEVKFKELQDKFQDGLDMSRLSKLESLEIRGFNEAGAGSA